MPACRKASPHDTTAQLGFEAKLWLAADTAAGACAAKRCEAIWQGPSEAKDKLRNNMEPAVAVPPPDIAERFNELTAPLMAKIKANAYQSRTLATPRDTLLPKLLSGELRAPDSQSLPPLL